MSLISIRCLRFLYLVFDFNRCKLDKFSLFLTISSMHYDHIDPHRPLSLLLTPIRFSTSLPTLGSFLYAGFVQAGRHSCCLWLQWHVLSRRRLFIVPFPCSNSQCFLSTLLWYSLGLGGREMCVLFRAEHFIVFLAAWSALNSFLNHHSLQEEAP